MTLSNTLARRLAHAAFDRIDHGRLTVVEDGGSRRFGPSVARSGAPDVTVTVEDPRAWTALVRHGAKGLATAYRHGWFHTADLTGLLRLAFVNIQPINRRLDRLAQHVAPLRDRLPRRSRGAVVDRANIAAHYDLSNDFFAAMLDDTMAYSCAIFDPAHNVGGSVATLDGLDHPDGADRLHTAQLAKFDRLVELLDVGPADHVLEIGTGWGGFAVHLARATGARVTTTTISAEQFDVARKRVAEAGCTDLVTVLDVDYRDLTGTYDRIVSVEMIEAVDHRDHAAYFETLAQRLAPAGHAVLQAIVIDDTAYDRARYQHDFIKTMIFPGGCLPSVTSITTAATATGRLATRHVTSIGAHYPATLAAWWDNLLTHRHEIADLGFGDEFLRLWQMYLEYCRAGFLEGHVDVVHVVLQRTR